jgi:tRNA G26 N,N-dimethylase Trm1
MSYSWNESWAPISKKTLKTGTAVILGITALSALSKVGGRKNRHYSSRMLSNVRHIVRHASRYLVVSQQDSSPLFSLMHAGYARAFLNVAMKMMPEKDIDRICGVDIHALDEAIEQQQQRAMARVSHACPKLQPSGVGAMGSGWVG